MSDIKFMILTIVKMIVTNEDQVRIEEEEKEQGVLLKIYVSKEDAGKLIGRGGRVAGAIRMIVRSASRKKDLKVMISVMNPTKDEA